MPAVKHPCLQCKEKHVKCDEDQPQCRRCRSSLLPCSRPPRRTVFRHDSARTTFSSEQIWVNSQVKHFRSHSQGTAQSFVQESEKQQQQQQQRKEGLTSSGSNHERCFFHHHTSSPAASSTNGSPLFNGVEKSILRTHPASTAPGDDIQLFHSADDRVASHEGGYRNENITPVSPPFRNYYSNADSPGDQDGPCRFPLEDVQSACLLRYFVEEMSHWFDLCDEQRHFQLIVPIRARQHPHLLNAIFAVAARHLSRLPQYKTPKGILYHGQLLPNLSEHDAVEYTLKCIPALRQFHDVQDDEYRDSIITTAVILRQLEEIDDEDDLSESHIDDHPGGDGPRPKKVNFLAIINAVLGKYVSQSLFGRRSLMQAAYWMALRQEIYHSFTRKQPPQLIPDMDFWQNASNANKTVMHTIQVAKWRWGIGSEQEWLRLMAQQGLLEREILVNFRPIFQRSADKSKGEIFPTVWYSSNIEVTSIQQAIMAKSVLVAENPFLRTQPTPRLSWRNAENEVRLLLLDLCGIALCHPASPPALLNAAIGIQLYGEYFTDRYERRALRGVVQKYRDARAWPVKTLLEMFRE